MLQLIIGFIAGVVATIGAAWVYTACVLESFKGFDEDEN